MAAAKKTTAKKSVSKKKSTAQRAAAKTSAAKKTAAKKTAAKKTPAKKTAAKKTPAKRAAATRSAAKKTAAKKPAAKQAPASKATAKKSASTSTTKKQAAASAAKKRATPKMPAKKSPAKKTAGRKAPASGGPRSSLLSNDVPEVHEIPPPRGTTKDGISYTKDFDVKFLKMQRDELTARRESEIRRATRLEDEAVSLIENGEMGDVQFDDEGGEGDTMVVQRDLDRLLSSQARQAVEEIDEALARIEAGTYGYSEVSGLPISRERLEALPATTVLAAEKVSGAGRR